MPHAFTAAERHAVYFVHGEACYLCRKNIPFAEMQIDHVVPESLLDDTDKLKGVLEALGRPATFDVNSFENWLPSCGSCNRLKSDRAFQPSLLVQQLLQLMSERAPAAKEAALKLVSRAQLSRAVGTIERAIAQSPEVIADDSGLRDLMNAILALRVPKKRDAPFSVSDGVSVSLSGQMTVTKGPFGYGSGPVSPSDAVRCGSCGFAAWNGARCVMCAQMDD